MTAFQWLLSSLTNKIDLEAAFMFLFFPFGNAMFLKSWSLDVLIPALICPLNEPLLPTMRPSPVFVSCRVKTSGCRCTRSWWKSPMSSTRWVKESSFYGPFMSLSISAWFFTFPPSVSCSSSILTSSLSYTKQTVKAGSRTLRPADMPYQQQHPPANRLFLSTPWGCKRRTFASFLPISPSVWRGERSCLWLSFKQTQQLCAAEVHCACSRHVHTLPFCATCNVSSISYRAATNEFTDSWLIAQVSAFFFF